MSPDGSPRGRRLTERFAVTIRSTGLLGAALALPLARESSRRVPARDPECGSRLPGATTTGAGTFSVQCRDPVDARGSTHELAPFAEEGGVEPLRSHGIPNRADRGARPRATPDPPWSRSSSPIGRTGSRPGSGRLRGMASRSSSSMNDRTVRGGRSTSPVSAGGRTDRPREEGSRGADRRFGVVRPDARRAGGAFLRAASTGPASRRSESASSHGADDLSRARGDSRDESGLRMLRTSLGRALGNRHRSQGVAGGSGSPYFFGESRSSSRGLEATRTRRNCRSILGSRSRTKAQTAAGSGRMY